MTRREDIRNGVAAQPTCEFSNVLPHSHSLSTLPLRIGMCFFFVTYIPLPPADMHVRVPVLSGIIHAILIRSVRKAVALGWLMSGQ